MSPATAAAAVSVRAPDGEYGEAHALGFVELRIDVADAKPGDKYSAVCEVDRVLEHGSAHNHTDNGTAVCAEGHADTAGAAGYGVGGGTVMRSHRLTLTFYLRHCIVT